MSADIVATAALVTYDVYKSYINPGATSAQLVRVSHYTVVGFGVLAASIAVAFNHAGFSVTYLITLIGILVDSAVIPMACTIMWKKQSLAAVLIAPILCSTVAVLAWLLTAYTHYGSVTIATTSEVLPLVAGNMMSLCGPIVVTPLVTYIRPDNFDWQILKAIKSDREAIEDLVAGGYPDSSTGANATITAHVGDMTPEEDAKLLKARNKAIVASLSLCLMLLILWPIPMYGTSYSMLAPSFSASGLLTTYSIFEEFFCGLDCGCLHVGILRKYDNLTLAIVGRPQVHHLVFPIHGWFSKASSATHCHRWSAPRIFIEYKYARQRKEICCLNEDVDNHNRPVMKSPRRTGSFCHREAINSLQCVAL